MSCIVVDCRARVITCWERKPDKAQETKSERSAVLGFHANQSY